MRYVFLLVMLALSPWRLYAQLNNTAFENRMAVAPADSGKLFLGINVMGFGKNNEYFDTTVDGYTLFGYQTNPFLSYHISDRVRLDAGVFVRKDFGNSEYSAVLPTFSLKIRKNDFGFIFGTLEGSLNHRLIEPLYDFERIFTNRIENGAQVQWIREGLFADVWVDWNKMIYFNDPEQERLTAGLSVNKTILKRGGFTLDVPVQAVITHRGGQIDQNPNNVLTTTNGAIGLALAQEGHGVIKSFGLKSYVVGYKSSSDELAFKDGGALFFNPYVTTTFGLTVMGSYWAGSEYLTQTGNDLYPSIVTRYPLRADVNREWMMLRLLYEVKVARDMTFTLRAEPFYDTFSQAIEYSYGFYLNINSRFFLLNAKSL